MAAPTSVQFFETQFQRQVRIGELALNPFEAATLPFLHGHLLDYGCGLGNLAIAAARRGCTVLALDASPTAIDHVRTLATAHALAVQAEQTDLRDHEVSGAFDAVACIGLLMFFDCATASRQLERLQACVRPGGVAAVNVLVEGTTFLDMFDPHEYCLFDRDALRRHFQGWTILHDAEQDFAAPGGKLKCFASLVARKPGPAA